MCDALEDTLRRVDIDRPRFTYTELRRHDDRAWGEVVSLGLVRRIEDTEWAACDWCGEEDDLRYKTTAKGRVAYLKCRACGPQRVGPERLQQWRVHFPRLAERIAAALGCGGRVEEIATGYVWLLGRIAAGGRQHDVFFARQLAFPEGADALRNCARYQASRRPVVVLAGVVPREEFWKGRVPLVLRLPEILKIEAGELVADRAYVTGALAPDEDQVSEEPVAPAAACEFRDLGKSWLVTFEGLTRAVPDSIGMDYLAELLRHPHREIHSARLRDDLAGEEPRVLGSAGEVLDTEALRAIKERLDANRAEQLEAAEREDVARQERLQEEFEFLRAEVARATGLGGRRREAASDIERARQAVSRAIHRALKAIAAEHPALARHLDLSVRIGEVLVYAPGHEMAWST